MDEILALLKLIAAKLGVTMELPTSGQPVAWWKPTAADYTKFASDHGVPVEAISPWVQDARGQISGMAFPILPAVTKKADILKYAGFGYGPDGKQRLFTEAGFTPRRKMCDDLAKATTPAEADYVLTGAGAPGVEADAVRLAVMTGMVSLNPFISPTMAGGPTLDDVIAQLTYVPNASGPNAPGPSGR